MTSDNPEAEFDRQALLSALAPTILAGLFGALEHADPTARHIAIVNLGRTGEAGLAAAARLAAVARQDLEIDLRREAVTALRDIGLRTLPWLLPLVQVSEAEIADLARKTLQDLAITPRQRVEKLIALLADDDVYVRRQALLLLTDILSERFTTPEIELDLTLLHEAYAGARRSLSDADDLVKLGAASLFWEIRRDNSAAPIVEAIAVQAEHPHRELAEQLLTSMGRRIPTVKPQDSNADKSPLGSLVESLVQDLRSDSSGSGSWALSAFFHFADCHYVPDEALEAVKRLVAETGGQNATFGALYVLSRVAHRSPEVHVHLIEALEHHADFVRNRALDWLGECLPFPEAALPAIVKKLEDSDEYVARSGAWLLKGLGDRAIPYVKDLHRVFQASRRPRVSESLQQALDVLDPTPTPRQLPAAKHPGFCRRMDDPDASIRREAINEAGHPGNVVPSIVEALVRRTNDADERVAQAARSALQRMGPAAQPLIVAALRKLGPDEQIGFQQFNLPKRTCIELLDVSNNRIRLGVIQTLSYCWGNHTWQRLANEHHRRLLKLLDDPVPEIVQAATHVIRRLPPLPDQVDLREAAQAAWDAISADPTADVNRGEITPEERQAAIDIARNPQPQTDLEDMLYSLKYLTPLDAQIAEIFLNYASSSDRKTRDAAQSGVGAAVRAEEAYWQGQLQHDDPNRRATAVRNLSHFLPNHMTPEVIADWERVARDTEPEVRTAVAKAFGRFALTLAREEDADETALRMLLGSLVALFGDSSEATSSAAAAAIGSLNAIETQFPGRLREWLPSSDSARSTIMDLIRRGVTSVSLPASSSDADWLEQEAERLSDAHGRKGKHKKL